MGQSEVLNGLAPQSQNTDEFSTLYICVRKGVVSRPISRVDEFQGLSMPPGLAGDTNQLPQKSAALNKSIVDAFTRHVMMKQSGVLNGQVLAVSKNG